MVRRELPHPLFAFVTRVVDQLTECPAQEIACRLRDEALPETISYVGVARVPNFAQKSVRGGGACTSGLGIVCVPPI